MANPAESFFGGLLVMGFIACMLYGITILQAFMYYQMYSNDTLPLKCLVIWVFFLDTSHTAFCITLLYYYLVANFGNTAAWKSLNWIYVRRIWFVSRKARLLTGFLSFIVFSRLCFGLGGTFCVCVVASSVFRSELINIFDSLNFTLWSNFKAHAYTLPIVSLSLSLGAFADLLIAITFSTYLLRGRNQYSRASRTVANMLTLYAINTGAATATTSVVSVIVYGSVRSSLAFLGLSEMGAKLYANSFLGSLNSRTFLRHKNLARGFSGFGPSSAIDFEFDRFPSDSPPPHEPRVSVAEFSSSIACETSGTRMPGEDNRTRV
ncbi:hypothetical protein V8D89_001964 [Ganoderma adspersum]